MNAKALAAACGLSIASTTLLAQGFGEHRVPLRGGAFAGNPRVQADRLAIENDLAQLRKDVSAGITANVSQDRAKVMADFEQLQADRAALRAAMTSSPAVQAAETALRADRVQLEGDRLLLETDRIARDASSAQADEAAITADETKLKADRKTLGDAIAALAI